MKKTVTKEVEIVVCDKCGREISASHIMILPMKIIAVDSVDTTVGLACDVQQHLTLWSEALVDPRYPQICHHCLIKALNDALTTLYKLPDDLHK